jgi:hypothetical protein
MTTDERAKFLLVYGFPYEEYFDFIEERRRDYINMIRESNIRNADLGYFYDDSFQTEIDYAPITPEEYKQLMNEICEI